MSQKTISITRSELYKKVWTTSITKLSKEFGLSDVGLAKICKRHNIPRPPRGFWARKAAGYRVEQIPLPPGEDVTIEITTNPYSTVSKRKAKVSNLMSNANPEEEPIPMSSKAIFPVIACHCDEDGKAWPGRDTICRLAGVSTMTVRRT